MIGTSVQTLEDAQTLLKNEFNRISGFDLPDMDDLTKRAATAFTASGGDSGGSTPLAGLHFMRGFMTREAEILALKKMVADLEGRAVELARQAQGGKEL